MGELEMQLRLLLQACGLRHLAFYDRDRAELFVAENLKPAKGVPAEQPSSSGLERAGRQLFYILEELAPDFAELRTGSLIRTVVGVPELGALVYQSVQPGFHLCCATPQDRVNELIPRMTENIDVLRPTVRYGLLPRRSHLSRYMTLAAESVKPPPAAAVPAATDTADSAESSAYTVESAADTPTELTDLLRTALHVDSLHYVAYYAAGAPVCAADIFRHSALSTYFGGSTTPQQRRDKYSLLGQLLPGVTHRMNTSLHALMDGRIHQVVLNVEQGAVYFQHLEEDRYLLGVSLDHSRLAEADRHIERLMSGLVRD
ncbi:hypothetical protein [Streptomyces sp. XY006]|uniref:hypothetical protein n=1 Tax=Streptomyces sp. XY006 TaxID=2021410 RepID=UPI000B8C2521|nr:hypothetical protein [Streptomyces sp. XY006]OXS35118.1 hypothetical protein CHR28_11345 [Streptomyces sp. XY006]